MDSVTGEGRAIYFMHDSTSKLPIRDISGEGKKEPHIEYGWDRGLNDGNIIGAENFCYTCYQDAIQKLIENDEEYLLLETYPKHPDVPWNENLIVGFIRNEDYVQRGENHFAVIGEMELYSFDDAIPAGEFGKRTRAGNLGKWGETYDEQEIEEILEHFAGCSDVTETVLERVLELSEEENKQSTGSQSC